MLILGIGEVFASIGIWLVTGIYMVASVAFEIFLVLADGSLLNSIDYGVIITNLYLIIGIIMLFVLAFSLLRGMINPDDQKQGTAVVKKVIINLITSAVIMAVLPTIFTFAFDFQKSFIYDYNPIGRFFGYGSLDNSVSNSGDSIKTGAYRIVNGIYTAFFNVNAAECSSSIKDCQNELDGDNGWKLGYAMEVVEETGDFSIYGNFASQVDKGKINFNFLLSLIGGLILIYVAVSYCFDMALRLVKLVFYQIIAPIPIFFRIIPEGKLSGTFNTWVKVTLTCYMEVYVRIFVFYFCVYLCQKMIDAPFFDNLSDRGFFVSTLSLAFVLMGIITFMRQAPKLISEITGLDSGNMKLGIREKLAAGGAFTAGAAIGGGLTAATRNATNAFQNNFEKGEDGKWHKKKGVTTGKILGSVFTGGVSTLAGLVSGGARSGKSGWNAKSASDMKNAASKGATDAVNARDKRATYKANHGGTISGVIEGHAKDAVRGVGEWAGIGVVTSTEADWFSSGANAFDAAHSQMESAYKGKPEHNKIKERMTELNGEYSKVNEQIKSLENIFGPLTEEQTQHLTELRSRLTFLDKEIAAQKAFKFQHESEEMGKKLSLQMEAINGLVNAKMKYFDMSSAIFSGEQGEQLYSLLKDAQGRTDSDVVKNLVAKIQQNQTISMSDLNVRDRDGKYLLNLKSLEEFVDQVSIKAKDIAAEKRVEVAHARALKDEKKSDGK